MDTDPALEQNVEQYDDDYASGYGLRYPDGHVIRFHKHILEYEFDMNSGTVLDYGCGTGTHLKYFQDQGFEPYGCDTSETSIERCKGLMPDHRENFHVIPPVPDLRDYFTGSFDLVISNQVLYFLQDDDLKSLIPQFEELLRPGGVFFATMIAPTNYYADHVVSEETGMSRVELRGRVDMDLYVNFKTEDEVLDLFSCFDKRHLGHYGALIREDDGPTDHWMYVGVKEA